MKKYLCLVAVALVSFALCSPLAAIETESVCAQAEKAWLAANADRLPTNFAEMMAIPEHERNFAMANVSSATRSTIWRGHLDNFLATEGPSLNEAQRQLVARAALLATPERFVHQHGDPGFEAATAPVRELVEEAKAHYTAEQVANLFYRLGGEKKSPRTGPIYLLPHCNCMDRWDCGGGACNSGVLCLGVMNCGPMGFDPCHGRC